MRRGHPRVALRETRRALAHDPHNWQLQHALVATTLASGGDARGELAELGRMNPRGPAARSLVELVAMRDRRIRTAIARAIQVYLP
jgi:hypothetical protein